MIGDLHSEARLGSVNFSKYFFNSSQYIVRFFWHEPQSSTVDCVCHLDLRLEKCPVEKKSEEMGKLNQLTEGIMELHASLKNLSYYHWVPQ